jgi:GNAT superfamily N-acetyltransferase
MGSLEQFRTRLRLGADHSDENPHIEVLTPRLAGTLRLPWLSRFSPATLASHLEQYSGMSLWVPNTGEYTVGERWRHRDDIANILEVTARKGKQALVTEQLSRWKSQGYRLALLSDESWRDQARLYMELGFGKIETIVFFEKQLRRESPSPTGSVADLPALRYAPLEPSSLETLLEIDRNSFPWLWWNSLHEFESYVTLPGVFVELAYLGSEPVGYASYTMYSGWAHLDRLAVPAGQQGRKYGASQLHHALERMIEMGAHSVALSTQQTNLQSHRLYRGFGFKQSPDVMHFYGTILDPSLVL